MAQIIKVVTPSNLSDNYFDKGINTTNKIEYKLKYTISNLKTATNLPEVVVITDNNKESVFIYDVTDTTSTGDDINTIVTNLGKRYKRKTVLLSEYNSVINRLNNLEYVPLSISTFTNNVNNVEKGTTVTSITFSYSYNKTPTSSSIDNSIGNVSGSSATKTVSVTTNTTYTLTASDGQTTKTATTSVTFLNKVYYGTSANTSLNNSQVLALTSNTLSSTKNRTITVNGGGQYIYYCYPTSFGDATFTINGLVSSAWTKTVQNVTNALGDVTSYNVYRTNTVQNGTGINITIS